MIFHSRRGAPRLLSFAAAFSASLLLSACGGSSNDEQAAPVQSAYQPYACDQDLYQGAHDLRIYQVMTEAFIDGDPNADYNTGYGSSHHKGDIQGIIDSLDYIKSLGMNALWVTPVFASIPRQGQDEWADRLDATGYYASDYFRIDPNFGTLEQARELVEKAHQKGLYVFFDGVLGHHKDNIVPSLEGRLPAGGSNPVSYPDSLEFYQEVIRYWTRELKIDGWRLDQAYQVPVGAWGELRRTAEQASGSVTYENSLGETVNPLGYMVAEIWSGADDIAATGYGPASAPGLCSAFDFPLRYALVQTLAVEENGAGFRPASDLADGFAARDAYPSHAVPNAFIGNHDLVRLGDLLQRGNIANPGDDAYWLRHKAAFSFLAAVSGPITLYYGEETGQELDGFDDRVDCSSDGGSGARAGLCDDHVARTSGQVEGLPSRLGDAPFTANVRQADLRDYLAELMALRAAHPALSRGTRTHIPMDSALASSLYVDRKASGDDVVLYLLNTATNPQTLAITGERLGSAGDLTDLMTGASYSINGSSYTIAVPALTALFLQVETPLNQD